MLVTTALSSYSGSLLGDEAYRQKANPEMYNQHYEAFPAFLDPPAAIHKRSMSSLGVRLSFLESPSNSHSGLVKVKLDEHVTWFLLIQAAHVLSQTDGTLAPTTCIRIPLLILINHRLASCYSRYRRTWVLSASRWAYCIISRALPTLPS